MRLYKNGNTTPSIYVWKYQFFCIVPTKLELNIINIKYKQNPLSLSFWVIVSKLNVLIPLKTL